MRFVVVLVCNRYWKRCAASVSSWRDAETRSGGVLDVCVATSDPYVPDEFAERGEARVVSRLDARAKKPALLLAAIERAFESAVPDRLVLTDADVVVPTTVLEDLGSPRTSSVFSSEPAVFGLRTHLSEAGTADFLASDWSSGAWISAKESLDKWGEQRDSRGGSPGMGWFQAFSPRCFSAVFEVLARRSGREGYDGYDHEIFAETSNRCGAEFLAPEPEFIHLWHGTPGENWSTTTQRDL